MPGIGHKHTHIDMYTYMLTYIRTVSWTKLDQTFSGRLASATDGLKPEYWEYTTQKIFHVCVFSFKVQTL